MDSARQVFIAYAHEDDKLAGLVAALLEGLGYTVWWDLEIPPGSRFDRVIQEAVAAASCIVVLWSKHSADSDWVLEEAEEGRARGILVPAVVDDVVIPLGFRRIQAAVLAGWDGRPDHPEAQRLARGVVRMAGPPITQDELDLPTASAPTIAEVEAEDIPAGADTNDQAAQPVIADAVRHRFRVPAWLARGRRGLAIAVVALLFAGGGILTHQAGLWAIFSAPLVFNEEKALDRLSTFKIDIYYDRYHRVDASMAKAIADTLMQAKLVRDVILVPSGPGLLDQAGRPEANEIRYHKWTEGEVGWVLWKELNERGPEWELQRKAGPDLRTEGTISIFLFSRYVAQPDSVSSSASSN